MTEALRITDEYYPEYDERERFVSGQFNTASIHEGVTFVTIGGNPEIDMTVERMKDLRDVLTAAVELAER